MISLFEFANVFKNHFYDIKHLSHLFIFCPIMVYFLNHIFFIDSYMVILRFREQKNPP